VVTPAARAHFRYAALALAAALFRATPPAGLRAVDLRAVALRAVDLRGAALRAGFALRVGSPLAGQRRSWTRPGECPPSTSLRGFVGQ
jgi:hypothetical protein